MNTDVAIPFLDLVTPHVELEEELTELFRSVLHTAGFIGGPMVENFETAFAEFCETRHAIAVNSGTDALRFAIMASGVQPGDVVLTVPNTFIATTEAISQARAIPEFVDVDEHTYNMSVVMLQRYLQKKCVRDKSGRLDQPSQRARRYSGHPGASLRTDGRHGCDPRTCRAVWSHRDRGCVPGARSRVLLKEAQSLDEGRLDGMCSGVQFLSRQESRGLWRGRCNHHQ